MRQAIPPEKRVAITLWWLAGYNCFREVSNQFGMAKSTIVGNVAEVCVAMDLELLSTTVCLGPPGREYGCREMRSHSHRNYCLDVTPSEHEGPSSPLLVRPVNTLPGAATVYRILYLLDLQQKAFRRLNRDVAQLRQTLGLPPAVIPMDSEGPCSDPGASARGDLPLAISSVPTSLPPVESGPMPPPAAGPSTSHGMDTHLHLPGSHVEGVDWHLAWVLVRALWWMWDRGP
ncbi:UNVERIFIED_CONTAM: hypothetical protein K2H54_008505 [Gekko kuhli]